MGVCCLPSPWSHLPPPPPPTRLPGCPLPCAPSWRHWPASPCPPPPPPSPTPTSPSSSTGETSVAPSSSAWTAPTRTSWCRGRPPPRLPGHQHLLPEILRARDAVRGLPRLRVPLTRGCYPPVTAGLKLLTC